MAYCEVAAPMIINSTAHELVFLQKL